MVRRKRDNEDGHEKRLRHGADATMEVSQWVRYLCASEYHKEGVFAREVRRHDEQAWNALSREVFSDIYGLGAKAIEPEKRQPGSDWVSEMLDTVRDVPEWQGMRERGRGDAWAASVASSHFLSKVPDREAPPPAQDAAALEQLAQYAEEQAQQAPKDKAAQERAKNVREAAEAAKQADKDAAGRAQQQHAKIRQAARDAASSAAKEIDGTRAVLSQLGYGNDPASPGKSSGPSEEVLERVRRDKRLQAIARLAGRLRSYATHKQSTKARPGAEEICDVVQGADISRLLPSELLAATEDATMPLLARKLAERSALNYELRGREHRDKGPIIVVLDESGSMSGERDVWAKSVALAMQEVASRQKRAFACVHFSTSCSTQQFGASERSPEKVLEMLESFLDGGTDIHRALQQGLQVVKNAPPFKQADLILVSDGCDSGAGAEKLATELREAGVSLYGVSICSRMPDWLRSRMQGYVEIGTGDVAAGVTEKLDGVFSI